MAILKKTHENTLSEINGKSDALVINGVNIVDVLNRAVHENSTIICRGGKISEIGPSSSLSIQENATVIELPGRYIIPGNRLVVLFYNLQPLSFELENLKFG